MFVFVWFFVSVVFVAVPRFVLSLCCVLLIVLFCVYGVFLMCVAACCVAVVVFVVVVVFILCLFVFCV